MNHPRFRFEAGDTVEIDGLLYRIDEQDADATHLISLGAGQTRRTLPHAEFWELYRRKDDPLRVRRGLLGAVPEPVAANLKRPFESFDPRWQTEALRRQEYVQFCDRAFAPWRKRRKRFPMRPEGYARIARIVSWLRRRRQALLEGKRVSALPFEEVGGSTLRRWHKRWLRSRRDLLAVVPCHDSKGSDYARLSGEIIEILGRWVQKKWLTLERPDAKPVWECACAEIDEKNKSRVIPLRAPSYATFLRFIEAAVSPYDKVLFREGEKAAAQKFREVHRAERPLMPLDVVEIDHTPLDILLVDEDGAEVGHDRREKKTYRVWLTIARCTLTKMIFGFHVSRHHPSWTSVMACMRMGVSEKKLDGLNVRSIWPVFGVPKILKMDNGPEFWSHSLRAAAGQLRMEIIRMPRAKGHMKGGVERVQGVINEDFIGMLPGRTFRDVRERGDYKSEQRAAVTLPKLVDLLTIYIVDIVHNRPMASLLGMTPLQKWQSLSGCGVSMPPQASDLDAILSLAVDRTVQATGITFLGLVYNSEQLQRIRKRKGHMGKMLMVKVDPYDLGEMLVLDEGDDTKKAQWISVPCLYPELADGVSLTEWKVTIDTARARVAKGQAIALSVLRAARLDIVREAEKLGAGPSKLKQAEIDWFRDNVNSPLFDVAPDPADAPTGDPKLPRGRGRPRKSPAQPDHALRQVGDGGHAPATQTDERDLAPIHVEQPTVAHADVATTRPSGETARDRFQRNRDPDNWRED